MPGDGELIRRRRRRRQLWLLAGLTVSAALVVTVFFLLDWSLWSPPGGAPRPSPLRQLLAFDVDTAQNALGSLAQVIAAILGIVITVASIVVQLAATRYTPRVAEMFFRDPKNLAVLGFFAVAGIDAVWVSLTVTREFVPRISIAVSLGLVTVAILLMVPYFAYVFDFLDPERVVARIQEHALAAALGRGRGSDGDVAARQDRVLVSIEQLGDVATNAVSQKDKLISQGAVQALRTLATRYLPCKPDAPPSWFTVGERLRRNADFVSMSTDSVDELAARRLWLEWKVLRQYESIFNNCIGATSEMSHFIAIETRYIGEAALDAGDRDALDLCVRFFNTYLRATLNAEQVRTAYNTLHQYRQLVEAAIAAGSDADSALAVDVAGYLRYYGQVAMGKGLSFVTETVAYDLATLCERAHARRAPCHDAILRLLLDLDREAETVAEERSLRGVRKAQAKLAAYYLASDAEGHARAIFEDMKHEPPARLASICGELLSVSSKYFWEVIDRGTNFDYMDDSRKAELRRFFSWFPSLRTPTPVPPASVIG